MCVCVCVCGGGGGGGGLRGEEVSKILPGASSGTGQGNLQKLKTGTFTKQSIRNVNVYVDIERI